MKMILPMLAAAAASVFVGTTMVATRFVIGQSDPVALSLLRYTIGFCCLLPPLVFAGRIRFQRRDLLPLGILGILQFGISIILLNYALQFIPSARAALLYASTPLLTMLLAALLGYERLTVVKSLGVGLTVIGVGVALGEQIFSPGSGGAWIGEAAAIGSALCAAICSVLYRPYLQRYSPLAVSAYAMLASVGFLVLIAAGGGFFGTPLHFTSGGWAAVGFIGVSSGIGYYLWLWALNHTSPTNVTVFLALSPIIATTVGAFWLAEQISPALLAGLACVALGILLAYRGVPGKSRKRPATEVAAT